MTETSAHQENAEPAGAERACAYRVLRYTPNLVRDEWVNIGVLVWNTTDWQKLLAKWDATLSNALQLAPQKGVFASDLDAELELLYGDHVAPQRAASRVGAPGSRAAVRSYCSQVFRQARLWERLEKSVRAEQFTATAAMARVDSCRRSPSPAPRPTPSFSLIPRNASPPGLPWKPNSLPSPMSP